jgi:glucose/arabinose dehydrogenase
LIRIIRNNAILATPFLNISGKIVSGGEQGLLSVAFHPSYASNGRFFVNYTAPNPLRSVIAEYRVSGNPDVADPNSERVILTVDQPFTNQNGGLNMFGPDRKLYIGLGDGGSGGDPQNNGQRLDTLLGKILRIDIDGAQPYVIPADNPFVGTAGARGEIWAYGFRNPWRYSFDRPTGRLFVADVGQGAWEEVDIVQKGQNYGWRIMEGAHCFNPSSGCVTTGLQLPITEYSHTEGCSVTGGYVYHGGRMVGQSGRYIFSDFCSGRIWTLAEQNGGTWTRSLLLSSGLPVSSFGEEPTGDLLVVDYNGGIYRLISPVARFAR